MPPLHRTRRILAHGALLAGALAILTTGADHLDEYAANGFSSVPTIGTLFLANFIVATIVGIGLLLPWRQLTRRSGDLIRALLVLSGIGIAASSLIGLWLSESASLFGFTDHGFRSTIVVAVIAESIAIVALLAYLALSELQISRPRVARPADTD